MPKCTFCDQPAITGTYISPAMCPQHHSLAILISLLKSRGHIASLENLRVMAAHLPQAKLKPDEVDDLLKPMRGHP